MSRCTNKYIYLYMYLSSQKLSIGIFYFNSFQVYLKLWRQWWIGIEKRFANISLSIAVGDKLKTTEKHNLCIHIRCVVEFVFTNLSISLNQIHITSYHELSTIVDWRILLRVIPIVYTHGESAAPNGEPCHVLHLQSGRQPQHDVGVVVMLQHLGRAATATQRSLITDRVTEPTGGPRLQHRGHWSPIGWRSRQVSWSGDTSVGGAKTRTTSQKHGPMPVLCVFQKTCSDEFIQKACSENMSNQQNNVELSHIGGQLYLIQQQQSLFSVP